MVTGSLAGLDEGLGDRRHVRTVHRLGLALVHVRIFCELRQTTAADVEIDDTRRKAVVAHEPEAFVDNGDKGEEAIYLELGLLDDLLCQAVSQPVNRELALHDGQHIAIKHQEGGAVAASAHWNELVQHHHGPGRVFDEAVEFFHVLFRECVCIDIGHKIMAEALQNGPPKFQPRQLDTRPLSQVNALSQGLESPAIFIPRPGDTSGDPGSTRRTRRMAE